MVNMGITNNDFIPWIYLPFSRPNKSTRAIRTIGMMIELGFMPGTCISLTNFKASWGYDDCIPIKECQGFIGMDNLRIKINNDFIP